MGKYGETAILAVGKLQRNTALSPREAWKEAAAEIFNGKKDAREKGCPKSAFLGLCEEGKIKNVPKGSYTKSPKNKDYALKGLAILQNNPANIPTPKALWEEVCNGNKICLNGQMDVVISLFKEDLTS